MSPASARLIAQNRYAYFRLDGSTSAVERQRGVDWFQSDASCKVALLSITAGGTGITLTASSTVVFAELTFTPALLLQAEDRVHRIGQPNAVNIHYLLGRHSLDDLLWPLLVRKMAVVGSSLDGEEAELEFAGVRGDDGQDKARFNVGSKGMQKWLEREEQRKTEQVKRDAALQERRERKWRDAIEIDDEKDERAAVVPDFEEVEGLSADREAELDEEVQDSMWVYVSDEDEKNFIVDDDEEEVEAEDDGEAEAEYKEDKEDDEHDEDERFDSDEDYEQPDDTRDEHADDDDDDGEAEYQPKQSSRGKKRVIRSDDDYEDDVKELLSNNSLTPLSSASSVSSASASQYQWKRKIENGGKAGQMKGAHGATRQEELRKRQRRDTVAEDEEEEREDDDEFQSHTRRKPSAASRSARDKHDRRNKAEPTRREEEEEEEEGEAEAGAQYNASDMSVLLLGMGYSASQVQSVLDELRHGTDEEQLYDVNTALETLIRQGRTHTATKQVEESKEAASDSNCVPCERCGLLVNFFDYTTHLGQCRRSATNHTSTPAAIKQPTAPSLPNQHADEQKAVVSAAQPEEAEVEDDRDGVEEQVRPKPAADSRRRRIIDLEDEEELEEKIVTSQDNKHCSGTDNDDVSVEDEVNVEWLDE